jgi:hypothetical protein
MTHVLLHDWWAAVDTALGVCHNKTYTRQQILSILYSLEPSDVQDYDLIDIADDPHDAENLKYLDGTIDQYIQERITGLSNELALQEEGEILRRRLQEVGFHSASVLVVVARM